MAAHAKQCNVISPEHTNKHDLNEEAAYKRGVAWPGTCE